MDKKISGEKKFLLKKNYWWKKILVKKNSGEQFSGEQISGELFFGEAQALTHPHKIYNGIRRWLHG